MTEGPKYKKGFTAEDIERYYSGKMSSAEMHQLEKAAMEDPFLADALEGYSYTSTPVKDVEQLRSQLQPKMKQGKVAPVRSFNKNQFLKIAALFIFLAGCGWAVYQFGFNQSINEKVALKKTEVAAPSIVTDSNGNDAAMQQSTGNAETNTQTTTTENDGKGTVSISTQNRHTGKENAGVNNDNNKQKALRAEDIKQLEEETAASLVYNEASSLKKDISADAKTKDTNSGKIASAPHKDNAGDVVVGYGTQRRQTVSPGSENVIVLQRSKNDSIPEVILSKSRMRDSNYRKPRITFEEAEPENGTAYYDDYVVQNLQIPDEELKKNISGEVKLAFDINDAGEAVNITVEKSLCKECDKEAIRLLKQGPRWKKKKDKKGKLTIKF